MNEWLYFGPGAGSQEGWPGTATAPRDADVVTIGVREAEILLMARRSRSRGVTLTHGRGKIENRMRMAARRLTARGLLTEPNAFGGGWAGWLYRYNLTERGRTCWLRIPKQKGAGQ